MAEVQPFRGWRYDIGQVGALADVTAPANEIITVHQQQELYQRHPCNIVRVLRNRSEIGDQDGDVRHERAADFMRHWRSEGVLIQDHEAAFYVYHQEFERDGQTFLRKGFLGRLRIEDAGQGIIPHEQSSLSKTADQLVLTRACRMNLSPILGLHAVDSDIQLPLEQAVLGETAFEAIDDQGVTHRVWAVKQPDAIEQARAGLQGKPIYIADGYHHYESARSYRDELRAAGQSVDNNAAANFVLVMLVGINDPSLTVAPTHRIISGLPPLSCGDLKTILGRHFEVDEIGKGASAAHEAWGLVDADGGQDVLAFGTAEGEWLFARLTDGTVMQSLAEDQSHSWRSLAVCVLHRLVIEHLMHEHFPTARPSFSYVHQLDEVLSGLPTGEHQLACLVAPPEIEHVLDIASNGELMPEESTCFYPRLLSGLILNQLD